MNDRKTGIRPSAATADNELPETILLTAEELRAMAAAESGRAAGRPEEHRASAAAEPERRARSLEH